MSVLEAKTRNALLVFVLIFGVISAVVLVSIEEPPEIACGAGDHPDKENRNGREVWGPTDMNSQIGNQDLMVATNEKGTVTVFKYPTPSYADQIKHHAFDRRDPYYGSDPNAGAFLGVIVTEEDGTERFDWLRDWGPVSTSDPDYGENVSQRWDSEFSDSLVTGFRNDELGLNVTVTNVVPKNLDVFVRDIEVEADADSPVEDVEVVSYENFNLVEDKDAIVPTQDWCTEGENGEDAGYDTAADAVVHEDPDRDHGLFGQDGAEFSVATAMAFDGKSTQHQVAGDGYMGNHPGDPYGLLTNGTTDLPGDDEFTGQTSAALTRELDFEDGEGEARVYFAAASDPVPDKEIGGKAVEKIDEARGMSLQNAMEEKEDWFRGYVEDAPMPEGAPENVTRVSRRALVSIVQAWDGETENEHGFSGNIIASVATQAPYGADWIRDGAYFNYVIDRYMGEGGDGKHGWVNKHNRWYMSLQQNPGGPCPEHCHDNMKYYDFAGLVPNVGPVPEIVAGAVSDASAVPEGAWAMNYYADGEPAGPLGGEIDETAYGAWTLWDHYAVTENETYLRRIYPAIKKVGDRLTHDCVDEETGLQCPRPEDDNFEKTQTVVGGASVYAGLNSAAKAAGEMYQLTGESKYAEQALAYAGRRDELGRAIERHYWNESGGYYGERTGFSGRIGSPSPRVVMPAFLRPLGDPKMESHMEMMWRNVNATFRGERDQGQYEAKSLIGLGIAARESDDPPVTTDEIKEGLDWIADKHARSDSTYVMGEAWVRETYADGEVDSAVSQPHIWEQSLFYLSSLIAYGNSTAGAYDRMANDVYREWRRHDAEVTGFEVEENSYAQGETVEARATVRNDADVAQEYFLRYEVEGPDGVNHTVAETDTGTVPPGNTEGVTVGWTVGSGPEEDTEVGSYDAKVSVWKAVETGENDTVDPEDIADEPTGLTAERYRRVELDGHSEQDAFGVDGSSG